MPVGSGRYAAFRNVRGWARVRASNGWGTRAPRRRRAARPPLPNPLTQNEGPSGVPSPGGGEGGVRKFEVRDAGRRKDGGRGARWGSPGSRGLGRLAETPNRSPPSSAAPIRCPLEEVRPCRRISGRPSHIEVPRRLCPVGSCGQRTSEHERIGVHPRWAQPRCNRHVRTGAPLGARAVTDAGTHGLAGASKTTPIVPTGVLEPEVSLDRRAPIQRARWPVQPTPGHSRWRRLKVRRSPGRFPAYPRRGATESPISVHGERPRVVDPAKRPKASASSTRFLPHPSRSRALPASGSTSGSRRRSRRSAGRHRRVRARASRSKTVQSPSSLHPPCTEPTTRRDGFREGWPKYRLGRASPLGTAV